MKSIYGETSAELSFERTHWRDEIWPHYSRFQWDGQSTICGFHSRVTAFPISTGPVYSEMAEILSAAVPMSGPAPRQNAEPSFGLKCTSVTDTALVLVSWTSGVVQVRLASGPAGHGRLGEMARQRLARLLAQAGAATALVPRKTDPELGATARLRASWKSKGRLLPPRNAVVYYDTPVHPVTPIDLPDSLRGFGATALMWVLPGGTTDQVRFLKPSPLSDVVLEAIKWQRLRFTPAMVAGEPIGAWVELCSEDH